MFHRSDRLLLRPPWPEDAQAIFAAIGEEAIVRNLARAPWPYCEDDARAFVALPIDPRCPRFLVTRTSDAKLVGCIGIDERAGESELGYWIASEFWGQGYATEAALAVLEIARLCGHRDLVAGHFVDNPASGRVLEKVGFLPTGEVSERHSAGRGTVAPCKHYALSLGVRPCLAAKAA
ncbi:N-acetyltransferase [Blastomonas marina]|uniref:N-acetyltransferase n=1 Tax=Blastomonas marina TaxID=1867408 RepID=A0ABQ1F4R0_9SPHN|nr:GNAT family N-acetyltransferase [Blastomonas marina]GFZ99455.1 N-acetyltransferase [Blastomonas marina]